MSIKAGAIIAGRYRLLEALGTGGMGKVWRAEHLVLRSHIALKLINDAAALDPDNVVRFLREAQAAAAIRSPHVVHVLDVGADHGMPYMAMELLEGESLAARLGRLGKLPAAQVARFVTHVARAIGRAHELGIVHRDLKPDNVFLVRNDDVEIAKVFDFGIAKLSRPLEASAAAVDTKTGALLGTPLYMSPEQAMGFRDIDHRADLYALALIAFACLCGREPFLSESVGSLIVKICTDSLPVPSTIAEVPEGFDAWFAKAAHREKEQRFSSAREMADALRAIASERTSAAPLSPSATPPPRSGAASERGGRVVVHAQPAFTPTTITGETSASPLRHEPLAPPKDRTSMAESGRHPKLNIVHADDTLLIAEARRLMLASWCEAPTAEQMRAFASRAREFASRRSGRAALWNLILRGTPNFRSEVRDIGIELVRDRNLFGLGVAHVVVVPGLVGAATRAFLSTMTLLGRPAAPVKVFDDEGEAARWIGSRFANESSSLTPSEITSLSDELRARAEVEGLRRPAG